MPINTIYRSTVGYLGSHRYYFEVIPNSTTTLSSPTVVNFPLAAFNDDWTSESKLNDEVFGVQSPDSLIVDVDLEMLPSDLKTIILNPFTNIDLTDYMSYKQPTRQDVPLFALTNVWLIKTDRGDNGLSVDEFIIMNSFGMKKNPSVKHEIINLSIVKKHKINIVLHDLVRICAEAVHPIFITWQAIASAKASESKVVKRVYDIVYGDNGSISDFTTVRVLYDGSSYPTSTTVDGVLILENEYILYQDVPNGILEILELVDDSVPIYSPVRTFSEGTISISDSFYIEAGTFASTLVLVELTDVPLPDGTFAINLVPTTNSITLTTIVGKVDGNVNGVKAHYFSYSKLWNWVNATLSLLYRLLLRVSLTDTTYSIVVFDTLRAVTFYKQTYDRLYTRGDSLDDIEVHFCALVENTGVWVDGYLAENDDNYGIFEYENIWDMFEKMKGMGISLSYYRYENSISGSANNLDGIVDSATPDEWLLPDIAIGDNGILEIETGKDTKRGAIVNINTLNDDKNEHKYILNGSISESEFNVKAMFHNNPSVDVSEEGWVDTSEYPELKTSLIRKIQKQNNPYRPFDAYKLVYFETPIAIADSEMAIRVHSSITATISDITNDYTYIPFPSLPTNYYPYYALKAKFIDLQRYSGMPYILARTFADLFSRSKLGTITAKVPVEFVAYKPVGQEIKLNISSLITTPSDMGLSDYWLLESKKIVAKDRYAEITLRQVK